MEIIVVDGATGEKKYSSPTPKTPSNTKAPFNKFPRILGDSLYFCDLRGTGRDADMIIKDRYLSVWAYNDKLELLWHSQCNSGHYPYAYDVDADGKDEVMIGYTLFDEDGTKLWTLDNEVKDNVMIGIMKVLREVHEGAAHFAWLDDVRRQAAIEAFKKAIEWTLAYQGGKPHENNVTSHDRHSYHY